MATFSGTIKNQFLAGFPEVVAVFSLQKVSDGDVIDFSTAQGGAPAFTRLKDAKVVICGDGAGGGETGTTLVTSGSVGINTKVQINNTGMAQGAAFLTIVGN